jgi:phage terminase small subunit
MKYSRKNRKRAKQTLRPPIPPVRLCYLAVAFWREFRLQNQEQEELDRKANRYWDRVRKFLGLKITIQSDEIDDEDE